MNSLEAIQMSNMSRHTVMLMDMQMILSGSYNQMYRSTYAFDSSGAALNSFIGKVINNGDLMVTANSLAGNTTDLISPRIDASRPVQIPNGWGEQRVRFVLTVKVSDQLGSETIYYFQGYSHHNGVSEATGYIDENMPLVLNSYIAVKRMPVNSPIGIILQDVVSQSGQILSSPGWTGIASPTEYMIRPQDMFNGLKAMYLTADNGSGMNSISTVANTMLRPTPQVNTRFNNIPTGYMSRMLKSYAASTIQSGFGTSDEGVLSTACGKVSENNLDDNPFLMQLAMAKGSNLTNVFTMRDLIRLDATFGTRVNIINHKGARFQQHIAGQTANLNGSDANTKTAVVLANAVPALMMELFINKIMFTSTNHSINSQITTTIVDAKTVTTADMTRFFTIFIERLREEILFDVTHGNQESFMLEMMCDVYGETRIKLQVGASGLYEYAVPTFADAAVSPVVAADKMYFNNMAQSFESVLNHTVDAFNSAHYQPSNTGVSVNNLI